MRRILLPALLVVAGCGTRPFPGEAGAPKAVVIYAPSRAKDAHLAADLLHDAGYDVVARSTKLPRSRSSLAVYGVHERPERVDAVTHALADGGFALPEVLPFQQHATGGNVAVLWLADDAR